MLNQVLKNHVAILLDTSGSMSHLLQDAVKIFNKQIHFLRQKSLDFDQETRVSVYTFNSSVECLISDTDVARPVEIQGNLRADGMTAMIDCMTLAISDLKELPVKYGDHSFILYILSDGIENASSPYNKQNIKKMMASLDDRWTIAAYVPDLNAKSYMESYGLHSGNIEKWDTTKQGIEELGQKFEKTMDNYFVGRKSGVKSSRTIFSDLKDVTATSVKKVLSEIKSSAVEIVINEGTQAVEIKPLVEKKTNLIYSKGCAYYELVKNEHVQPQKEIIVQNKKTGKFYSGDNARKLLQLPNQEVKIVPGDFGEWIVYVQSTSVNRKVIPKQRVLVLKGN